jgi:DNA-directed RNA polymerase subunit RPC12/RpoP
VTRKYVLHVDHEYEFLCADCAEEHDDPWELIEEEAEPGDRCPQCNRLLKRDLFDEEE